MTNDPIKTSKRVLEPHERIAEVLFGLIMVLTFTGSLSVAEAGRSEIRHMLIGALGCNLAWGVIDGVFYLMTCLAEKGRNLMTYRAVHQETDPQKAQQLIADALPPVMASILQPAEIAALHQRLQQLPEPPGRARLSGSDWRGSLGVFLPTPPNNRWLCRSSPMSEPCRWRRNKRMKCLADSSGIRGNETGQPIAAPSPAIEKPSSL